MADIRPRGRSLIAGAVPNTSEQMVRWIRSPQSIDPQTTMPDLQVGERDARDMGRADAPLRPAADAVMIDTTALDAEAALEVAQAAVERALRR